jgi:CRP-like cAMP-binding protein
VTIDPGSLTEEVRLLRRLIATSSIRGMIQKDQISFLDRSGFHPAEIADIVGTSPHNVAQTLHIFRKQRKEGAAKSVALKRREG